MSFSLVLALALLLIWVSAFVLGVFALYFYILWRMMRNDGWDKSNLTNAQRLLSHVVLHAEDFGEMHYLTDEQRMVLSERRIPALQSKRPFWYINQDEFKGVVKSRPPK